MKFLLLITSFLFSFQTIASQDNLQKDFEVPRTYADNYVNQIVKSVMVNDFNLVLIEFMLENGILDPNESDEYQTYKLLHLAVLAGSVDLQELLLRHGARVDALDCMGATPLIYALRKTDVKSARLLLNSGANVNYKGGVSGQGDRCGSLMIACQFGMYTKREEFPKLIELLASKGCAGWNRCTPSISIRIHPTAMAFGLKSDPHIYRTLQTLWLLRQFPSHFLVQDILAIIQNKFMELCAHSAFEESDPSLVESPEEQASNSEDPWGLNIVPTLKNVGSCFLQ